MKIAFESQLLLDENRTGIGWCADNLVKEIARDPEFECLCDYFAMGQTEERLKRVNVYEKYGAAMNPCQWFNGVRYKMIWPIIPIPYRLFFKKDRDITQFFNFVVPPGVKGKVVTIVHDMAYKAYPNTVNKKTRSWLEINMKASCRRADVIITVSEFSKQEIIKYMNINPEKIKVMPNGVDLDLYHPGYNDKIVTEVKSRYRIGGDYLLYLGTLEPRKNIERIIEAYSLLIQETDKEKIPLLVIAGGKGWLYDSIFETVKKLRIEDRIIFTGYVDEKEVPVLMKGARAFLFPSLYEGFGMPPLEAMACGTPVISSNTTSLPEVVGEAGLLVDPLDTASIKEGMKKIIEDKGLAEELGRQGRKRALNYTWRNSADILKQIYRELI